ncbi:hypothetical protein GGTG_08531 [Gaeumannomyces tritici R3-111a-1]|uniref:Uncharacterized protein n=1 Tax=Gaeumannomyces tritici (strain R3-111a-1) TaxID=644352 RepID=J3P4U5_GAET3|nr:hypothetical protein GGTG_08531 [Gaeumannomyces tritici R3-111a-1]EJT74693.1 hypothetical protein GGTG_08531 [Gaeumannomyces tritici R3-111a-1]
MGTSGVRKHTAFCFGAGRARRFKPRDQDDGRVFTLFDVADGLRSLTMNSNMSERPDNATAPSTPQVKPTQVRVASGVRDADESPVGGQTAAQQDKDLAGRMRLANLKNNAARSVSGTSAAGSAAPMQGSTTTYNDAMGQAQAPGVGGQTYLQPQPQQQYYAQPNQNMPPQIGYDGNEAGRAGGRDGCKAGKLLWEISKKFPYAEARICFDTFSIWGHDGVYRVKTMVDKIRV